MFCEALEALTHVLMVFSKYFSSICRLSPRSLVVLVCMTFITRIYSEDKIKFEDYILCRSCGTDISSAGNLVNRQSPIAVKRVNRSLFGVDEVYVQTLVNPLSVDFKLITVKESSCTASAEDWSKQHTWFPGFAWKPCRCSHCRRHLGWVFEPFELTHSDKTLVSEKGFYGLILDNLISELLMDTELTPEQQELLSQCEADFADRYTERDPDYVKVLTPAPPPIVHPWYNHARRNYDWGGGPRRDQDGRDRWRDRHNRSDDRHNRSDDRHNRSDDRHHNRHHPYHRNR